MPRSRRRSGGRRAIDPSARTAVDARPIELETPVSRPTARPAARMGRGAVRTGVGRAFGQPSQALERAATQERAYVTKDFRRLGLTSAAMLVLLVIAGLVENALLK